MIVIEYRVRVERFGLPDSFYAKKDIGKALKMLEEWREDAETPTRLTLNATAVLTIEVREVSEWRDITKVGNDDEATVLLGKGDFDA